MGSSGTKSKRINIKEAYKNDGKENKLYNINSRYILKHLMGYLSQKKLLQMIRYNKKIQNIMNIGLINYEEYSQIEIELNLLPIKKGMKESFIYDSTYKYCHSYYHIYFDDNKKEIKRNYYTIKDKFNKIRIIIDYNEDNFRCLFCSCHCIKSIKFKNFKRNNITSMYEMFYNCTSLESIDFYDFNTGNVTNMEEMFYNCSSLKELNLSKFNTSNVTDMSHMFYNCSSLKKLDLSNFNTNNVTDMSYMFRGCSSLKELNLNNFNTNNVTNMSCMFSGSLEDLI